MEQVPSQKFASECGRATLLVENTMPLGQLHDFLLRIKGEIVDRMVNVQKQEDEIAQKQKEEAVKREEVEEEECECCKATTEVVEQDALPSDNVEVVEQQEVKGEPEEAKE